MSLFRFFRNRSANVAPLFALCVLPLCTVGGFAIDFDHTHKRKQKVQSVLDASVLAAARVKQSGATNPETKLAVHQFMNPQLDGLSGLTCTPPQVRLSPSTHEIIASTECEQETGIMHIVGHDHMPFKVEAASSYTVPKVDVAFMFDVSNSMRGSARLGALKRSVNDAIDIILPSGAPTEIIENTRLAMVTYGSHLNAGPFFEAVTGVPPTRTYYHEVETEIADSEITPGRLFDEMHIGLYDTDSSRLLYEFGDGAMLKVKHREIDDLSIAIIFNASNTLNGQISSMRLQLDGPERAEKTENVTPFSLYGDSGIDNLVGERWVPGDYTLRIRGYSSGGLSGVKRFDETLHFEIFVEGQKRKTTHSHTITSTCVWERNSPEAHSDAPPAPGNYMAHHKAWFEEDRNHPDGGRWQVGFDDAGLRQRTTGRCSIPEPVELTNNRQTLRRYVSRLSTDGYTAGHLGVAWAWYLISDRWGRIFDGSAKPASFTDPDLKKAVVLMTDGEFNVTGYHHSVLGKSREQAETLCDNMKAQGIRIFSVAFRAPARGQAILQYCASNAGHYYQASNQNQLHQAYEDIAIALTELRISQ